MTDADARSDDLQRVARETFGWRLRPAQVAAMRQVMAGHDVLVVMPTGSGKSAIYQVPALLLDGPTLVVSPLIALQRDQVAALSGSRAPEAVAVNSAQAATESEHAWTAIRNGRAEYLFLAPEQLARDEVTDRLAAAAPSLVVVDEAHCVSSWGHDFRPDYLRLGAAIERLGHPRVLALTATAAPPVRKEIVGRLSLRDVRELVTGFDRPNLRLAVEHHLDDAVKRVAVVERAASLPKPGLVYVGTRADAEQYAAELADLGLAAGAYHAGRKADRRRAVHERFTAGDLEVVVATSAFGMGIDKPNVRFVLHADVPAAPDEYYQAIGRAGRDGEPAQALLLYRPEDLGLQRFLTSSAPDVGTLTAVGSALADAGPVRLRDLGRAVDVPAARRTRALNLLQQAGAVASLPDGRLVWADPALPVDDAIERAVDAVQARQRVNRSRLEMMRGYAETSGCRRQFLLGYFGERLDAPCGNCDTCAAGTAQARETADDEYPVSSRVRHAEWGTGTVMSTPDDDRVTVLFEEVGYKTLSLTAVRDAGLLHPVESIGAE